MSDQYGYVDSDDDYEDDPCDHDDYDTDLLSGRCQGWRWQVWFCRSDESVDPASGAKEWMATSTRFWRWITAARIANEMWGAFNDGVWIANCRHIDAANAQNNPVPTAEHEQEVQSLPQQGRTGGLTPPTGASRSHIHEGRQAER